MMMSKPAPTKSEEPAAAKKPAAAASAKKKSPQDAVADLERRLAELTTHMPAAALSASAAKGETPAAAAPASALDPPASETAVAAPAAATAPSRGGKNALLARIMAAQERAKQAQGGGGGAAATASPPKQRQEEAPPPYTEDLLGGDSTASSHQPLSFDEMLLPPSSTSDHDPHLLPPPAFDDALLPPPAAMMSTIKSSPMVFDPLALSSSRAAAAAPPSVDAFSMMMAPPEPSAPSFEDLDLLGGHSMLPPPVTAPPGPAPPVTMPPSSEADSAVEMILGLEGLSEAEKRELLEEQKRIMAAIEADKASGAVSSAAARADAFEQRSFSANVRAATGARSVASPSSSVKIGNETVPLHGAEATRKAMEDGTALTVQCLACDNWMQVTKEATMMFCPVCSTVSPVVIPEGGSPPPGVASASASKQMSDDMALAEALQQEEYDKAERQDERRAKRSATGATATAKPAESSSSSQGWMEWLGLSSSSASASKSSPERPASFAQPPAQRGYQGVSLPPGASSSSASGTRSNPSSPPRMMAAQTETVSFEEDAEDDILLNRGRVAAQKPLFSCVADSITSAATSLYATTLPEDEEGNVHGVDSSSLLAVTNFRRQEEEDKK